MAGAGQAGTAPANAHTLGNGNEARVPDAEWRADGHVDVAEDAPAARGRRRAARLPLSFRNWDDGGDRPPRAARRFGCRPPAQSSAPASVRAGGRACGSHTSRCGSTRSASGRAGADRVRLPQGPGPARSRRRVRGRRPASGQRPEGVSRWDGGVLPQLTDTIMSTDGRPAIAVEFRVTNDPGGRPRGPTPEPDLGRPDPREPRDISPLPTGIYHDTRKPRGPAPDASLGGGMSGTSTPTLGFLTSSRQDSTASSRPTSRRRRETTPRRLETPQALRRLGRGTRLSVLDCRQQATRAEPAPVRPAGVWGVSEASLRALEIASARPTQHPRRGPRQRLYHARDGAIAEAFLPDLDTPAARARRPGSSVTDDSRGRPRGPTPRQEHPENRDPPDLGPPNPREPRDASRFPTSTYS